MKVAAIAFVILALSGAIYFYAARPSVVAISPQGLTNQAVIAGDSPVASPPRDVKPPLAPITAESAPDSPLANPPSLVFGKYFTAWSAGSPKRMNAFAESAAASNINAAVIDIKDYSGFVSYRMPDAPEAAASGADRDVRIADPNGLIRALHAKGIYVIGRVTVFQDPIFAKAHPELALKNKTTGGTWYDNRGLAWLDPAGKPTWDYVISIAKDGFARGIDEMNFDYIRFPSDGSLLNAEYPFWDKKTPRRAVMRDFFSYLRQALPDKKISADLFGLVTVAGDDMGIGQELTDALPYFDYISPMVYPSHFASGFQGYKNPAAAPYQVINYSMGVGLSRRDYMAASSSSAESLARFRPWLQVFDLGAIYTPAMVKDEIKAVSDVFGTSTGAYAGWLLWDPANSYRSYDAGL